MLLVEPAQANIIVLDAVAKASGNPIVAGTVNFYLRAKDGANAGKWYRLADTSWQAAESISGAATHAADGHWYLSLASGVWTDGVSYSVYPKETGDLHIPVSVDVYCGSVSANVDKISDDAPAAAALETMLDGTGGNALSLGRLVVSQAAATAAVEVLNTAGPGMTITTTGADDNALTLTTTDGHGLLIDADGTDKYGVFIDSDDSYGLYVRAEANAVHIVSAGGNGIDVTAGGAVGLSIAGGTYDIELAGTGELSGIINDLRTLGLDHLIVTACPSNVMSNVVVDKSIIAQLCGYAGDISSWDESTDTLGEIALEIDALQDLSAAEVNTCLTALNLDHLAKVACDSNIITNNVVDHSIIAKMMANGGDISDWVGTTDTLEDIYNKTAAVTGAGAVTWTLTIYEDDAATPIDGASVWLTTNAAGTTMYAGTKTTNTSGEVVFTVDDAVTYYVWTQMTGWNFTNPTSKLIASAVPTASISAGSAAASPSYSTPGLTSANMVDLIEEYFGWVSPTASQSAECLELLNKGYRRFLRGEHIDEGIKTYQFNFLKPISTLTLWPTTTGTTSGAPSAAAGSSTVTATAAKFYASMVGRSFTFDTSETSYTINGYTSTTVISVSGDASGEAAGDTFTITADGWYGLPDTFGGIVDPPTYVYDGSGTPDLVEITPAEMDEEIRDSTTAGTPEKWCLSARDAGTSTTGQTWDMRFHQIPTAVRVVRYRYRELQAGLTDAATYTPGGQDHCDTVLAAGLAEAERSKNIFNGPEEQKYQISILTSIAIDSQSYGPRDVKSTTQGKRTL